jgi:hypothetical protein
VLDPALSAAAIKSIADCFLGKVSEDDARKYLLLLRDYLQGENNTSDASSLPDHAISSALWGAGNAIASGATDARRRLMVESGLAGRAAEIARARYSLCL